MNVLPVPEQKPLKFIAVGNVARGFIAFGNIATGFIAVGNVAYGVVSIGFSISIGVVSFGLNAVGVVAAFGVNAAAPVSVAFVNAIGVVCLSLVNALGTWANGGINSGGGLVVAGVIAIAALVGSFIAPRLGLKPGEGPGAQMTTTAQSLLQGNEPSGWVRAVLLRPASDAVCASVDGDEMTVFAPQHLAQRASQLLSESNQRNVFLNLAVVQEPDFRHEQADYRSAVPMRRALQCVDVAPAPAWWHLALRAADPILRWSARAAALVSIAAAIGAFLTGK